MHLVNEIWRGSFNDLPLDELPFVKERRKQLAIEELQVAQEKQQEEFKHNKDLSKPKIKVQRIVSLQPLIRSYLDLLLLANT